MHMELGMKTEMEMGLQIGVVGWAVRTMTGGSMRAGA